MAGVVLLYPKMQFDCPQFSGTLIAQRGNSDDQGLSAVIEKVESRPVQSAHLKSLHHPSFPPPRPQSCDCESVKAREVFANWVRFGWLYSCMADLAVAV